MQKTISLAEAIRILPTGEGLKTLHNPTPLPVRCRMFIAPASGDAPSLWCNIKILPNSELDVPAAWVHALVTVRDGMVIGGMAPQLRYAGMEAKPSLAMLSRRQVRFGLEE